jgi:GT2 family glycosyltransferase
LKVNTKPELSIVLLNFNRLELTRKSVTNILGEVESVDFELIIVDNNSTDGTKEFLRELKDPRVRLVLNGKNLFFGGGLNCGLKKCEGQLNHIVCEILSIYTNCFLTRGLPE